MAEIPVEKKSGGIPGWVWLLLGLLLLALLLWWLLGDDDDDVAMVDEPAAVEQVDTMAPAAAAGAVALVPGEEVDLDNVRVTSLAGDMAFNAEINGEPVFVVFNQEPTPGDPTEGEYDINEGSIINMTGRVISADEGVPANVDATIPPGTEMFIFADTIEMVS